MPAEPSGVSQRRHDRNRSRSPWVQPPAPISADVVHGHAIYNDNYNQNAVNGPAHILNSNPNFNMSSSVGAVVHYHPVTSFNAPPPNILVSTAHGIRCSR